MGWRDDVDLEQRVLDYRRQVTDLQFQYSPDVADRLGFAFQAHGNLNPEIVASTVLGGGDNRILSDMEKVAVEQMLADGVGRDADKTKNDPDIDGEGSWFDSVAGAAFSGLKAASRGVFTVLDSFTETAVGVLGTPFSPGARQRIQERGFYKGLGDYLSDIPQSTSLWEVGSQFAERGFRGIDMGSGYFVGGEAEADQTQAQRELVGTVERDGQVYAWTPGRGFADLLSDTGIISENDWAYNIVSGTLDATVALVTDPTNLIPGVGWGDEVIKGVKATRGRRALKFTRLIEEADRFEAAGDAAAAAAKRRRAMDVVDAKIKDGNIVNPVELAIRDQLLSEIGRGTDAIRSVDVAKFYAHLTTGSGRRLVQRMMETTRTSQIYDLHQGRIGPALMQELKDATTAEEVVGAYMKALLNPAADLSNSLTAVPNMGLFRMTDKKLWVRRNMNGFTRIGRMMPESSILDHSKPTEYLKRLDQLLKVLPTGARRNIEGIDPDVPRTARYNMDLRDDLMDRTIEALASGDQAAIFRLNGDIAGTFAQMLKNLGYAPESVKLLTKWSNEANSYMRFEMNRIGRGGEDLDEIPLLVSQLLSSGASVIDPSALQDIVRNSGRFKQFRRTKSKSSELYHRTVDQVEGAREELVRLKADPNSDPVMLRQAEKDLDDMTRKLSTLRTSENDRYLLTSKGVGLAGDWFISGMWKPFQLVRGAFIARVVGEETMRVLNSGTFGGRDRLIDYFRASFRKGYETDALGNTFRTNVDRFEEVNVLRRDLDDEMFEARRANNVDEMTRIQNQMNELDVEIDALMDQINDAEQFFHQALLNSNPGAAYAAATKNPKKILYQSGQAGNMDRLSPQQLDRWVQGTADRFLKYHFDVPMRQLARGGPGDIAQFRVNGVMDNMTGHVRAGRIATDDEAMAHWMIGGGGREYLDKMANAYRVAGKTFDPDSVDDVLAWVGRMKEELRYMVGGRIDPVTGRVVDGDAELMQVIATGRFRGQTIKRVVKQQRNTEIDPAFMQYVREYASNDNAPQWMEYLGNNIYGEEKSSIMQRVTNAFFTQAYGSSSDTLARSPSFRRIYWKQVAQYVDRLSADDAARMLEKARGANISKVTLKQIEARAVNARGVAKLEDIDGVAKGAALAHVRDLLFDASQRGATFDQMRLIIPFGDAWKEVMTTWARLFTMQRGVPLYRGLRAGEAAMGADAGPFGPGDIFGVNDMGEATMDLDGVRENFVYQDPTAKDLRVMIPGSRQLSKLILGGDMPGVGLPIPVRNMSIAGGLLPGVGPIADRAVNTLIPEDPSYEWLRGLLFPFGAPAAGDTEAGRQGVEEILVPAWAKKLATIIPQDTPILGFMSNLLNDRADDPAWKATFSQMYAQAASSGMFRSENDPFGASFETQQEMQAYAERAADKVYSLRGLMQFFAPGSPLSTFMASTEDGDVVGALLVEQLRDLENALLEQGAPVELALGYMLDTYGPNIWLYSAPVSSGQLKGIEATDGYFTFYGENRDTIEQYPLFGGFFGPTGGEFAIEAYGALQREGVYQVGTPQERYEIAARSLGFLAYNRLRDAMAPEEFRSDAERIMLANARTGIEQYFNVDLENAERRSERERQINQAISLVQAADAGISGPTRLVNSPAGEALRTYLTARERVMEMAQNYGIINWQQARAAAPLRDGLRVLARSLSEQNQQFAKMWEFVFDREMLDDLEVAQR